MNCNRSHKCYKYTVNKGMDNRGSLPGSVTVFPLPHCPPLGLISIVSNGYRRYCDRIAVLTVHLHLELKLKMRTTVRTFLCEVEAHE